MFDLLLAPVGAIALLAGAAQEARVPAPRQAPVVRVRVVDAADGEPVGGARVECLPCSRLPDAERARGEALDRGVLEETRARAAVAATTDAQGHAELRPGEAACIWSATADGRFDEVWIDDASLRELELRLAPDATVRARVVDAAGHAVAGLPVDLLTLLADTEDPRREPAAHARARVRTDADGVATFRHVQACARAPAPTRALERFSLRVAAPVFPPLAAELPAPGSADLSFRLPPTGRVVLRFPGATGGLAALRAECDDDSFARSAGFAGALRGLEAPIADGRAEFAWVGVDAPLVCAFRVDGRDESAEGRLLGPPAAGATVEFAPEDPASYPTLRMRPVDERGEPFPDATLDAWIELVRTDTLEEIDGCEFSGPDAPDPAGRSDFLLLGGEGRPGVARRLRLTLRHSPEFLVHVRELPDRLPPGITDLGDVPLLRARSRVWLARLDDDELERTWHAARVEAALTGDAEDDGIALLREMCLRGGSRWPELLRRELDALHAVAANEESATPAQRARWGDLDEIALASALARLELRSPPLQFELTDELPLRVEAGQPLAFRVRLRNADPEVALPAPWRDANGILADFEPSVADAPRDGAGARDFGIELLPLANRGFPLERGELGPGATLDGLVFLPAHRIPDRPGLYRLRIVGHDGWYAPRSHRVELADGVPAAEVTLQVVAPPR